MSGEGENTIQTSMTGEDKSNDVTSGGAMTRDWQRAEILPITVPLQPPTNLLPNTDYKDAFRLFDNFLPSCATDWIELPANL